MLSFLNEMPLIAGGVGSKVWHGMFTVVVVECIEGLIKLTSLVASRGVVW